MELPEKRFGFSLNKFACHMHTRVVAQMLSIVSDVSRRSVNFTRKWFYSFAWLCHLFKDDFLFMSSIYHSKGLALLQRLF